MNYWSINTRVDLIKSQKYTWYVVFLPWHKLDTIHVTVGAQHDKSQNAKLHLLNFDKFLEKDSHCHWFFYIDILMILTSYCSADTENCHLYYHCQTSSSPMTCGDMMFNTKTQVRSYHRSHTENWKSFK